MFSISKFFQTRHSWSLWKKAHYFSFLSKSDQNQISSKSPSCSCCYIKPSHRSVCITFDKLRLFHLWWPILGLQSHSGNVTLWHRQWQLVVCLRMNSLVSPSMSLEASGIEGVSSWRTDARGENDGLASFMGSRCMAWAGASPKFSCLEELSAKRRSSLVEHFEGGLHDGESSTQRFTEHCCSSCIYICIHLCLKSLALDTNPSHFLHISVERESLSVMLIPHTFRIFEARSSLLPSFLLALPKTRVKWRLSNASQQNLQIKFRGWTSLGVDSRQFSEFCSFYAARMASFEWRFPPILVPRVLSYPPYQAC